ncbi:hypothetical protein SCLCIDRAFT_1126301 [Scleroderma citrinum Foug A]|uniref:Uncharacterized protein n=1 Tax=Scleroderma citrinum Foug A TaxID=1036808 RepID=A0A0C2ZZ52_9AGAM|nr:hypothetical protein SCLCIDRAFT_1126301 [Scleroderma citrinum Foug A]
MRSSPGCTFGRWLLRRPCPLLIWRRLVPISARGIVSTTPQVLSRPSKGHESRCLVSCELLAERAPAA